MRPLGRGSAAGQKNFWLHLLQPARCVCLSEHFSFWLCFSCGFINLITALLVYLNTWAIFVTCQHSDMKYWYGIFSICLSLSFCVCVSNADIVIKHYTYSHSFSLSMTLNDLKSGTHRLQFSGRSPYICFLRLTNSDQIQHANPCREVVFLAVNHQTCK